MCYHYFPPALAFYAVIQKPLILICVWSNKTTTEVCNKLYLERRYLAFTFLAINIREKLKEPAHTA